MSMENYTTYVGSDVTILPIEERNELERVKGLGYDDFCLEVRGKRNDLLAETDWWALSDHTTTAEQTAYRQALRDVPSQDGFPTNVTWPTKPS